VVPRWGERRTALVGIVVAGIAYFGFGAATRGWMMFAWLTSWFLAAIVMPTTNAIMSHRVPHDAQGELQGAVASLFSLSAIIGPPIMTQLFGFFTSPQASLQVPGIAFFLAGALTMVCLAIFWNASRDAVAQAAVAPAA